MMKKYKALAILGAVSILTLLLCLLPSSSNDDISGFHDASLEIDPFFNDIYSRLLKFKRNQLFDLKITPVDNMIILLQTLDSFYLCDEDWMKDMQACSAYLKEQYRMHKNSLDPQMQELMNLQKTMIEKLDILIREADSDCIHELKEAFDNYKQYYEGYIKEGGTLNGGEKAG